MELASVHLSGYKRFKQASTMNTSGKIIAIVGPNEAGKTSLLRALVALDEERDFAAEEHTRGPIEERDILVSAEYELDEADRKAIEHLTGGKDAQRFRYWRHNEQQWRRITPGLSRDLRPRNASVRHLVRLQSTKWLAQVEPEDALLSLLETVVKDLNSSEDMLDPEQLERLSALAEDLEHRELPKTQAGLAERLRKLHEHESAPRPLSLAADILEERRPRFLLFDDDERLLHAEYKLSAAPNGALRNVLRLAKLDWDVLVGAYDADDEGKIEALIEEANVHLKMAFGRAWSQRHTPLTVRLRVDSGTLKILVPLHATDYVPVSHRSDGLRQFIALRAFVTAYTATHPVLLIDEAERHLHYDAQADLVDVLTEQTDAPKIIYTTHSAGCLPKDLGTGIRAIVPIEGTDDSLIDNWFWTHGPGLSPLLIGMGASALAFASARKAVIAEGITDAMLLPTLIKEAVGIDAVAYQVAPGLSNASRAALADLDLVAARVVYLVDGDAAGMQLRKDLLDTAVPESLVIALGMPRYRNLTVEDLLDPEVFLVAVNAELKSESRARMTRRDLVSPKRWNSVRRWCAIQRPPLEPPSKRAVAQRVLDMRRERPLLAAAHRSTVRRLHREIERALHLPAHAT